jgi:hypothetical protein
MPLDRSPGTWCGKCTKEHRSVLHCRAGGQWRKWCLQCCRDNAATVPTSKEMDDWFDAQDAKAEKKVRKKQ